LFIINCEVTPDFNKSQLEVVVEECFQLVGRMGKVYAVEPVYENFDVMKTNIKLNRLSNVGSYRFAFGEKGARSKT
jgi:hypothetical protein